MKLLKIGTYFINPEHIVWADILNPDDEHQMIARVTLTSTKESLEATYVGSEERLAASISEVLLFYKKDAAALAAYLDNPDIVEDIDPSGDVQAFQYYRSRGGDMTYVDFYEAFRRHKRLCAIENPTSAQLSQASELEHALLY